MHENKQLFITLKRGNLRRLYCRLYSHIFYTQKKLKYTQLNVCKRCKQEIILIHNVVVINY
jgi:hypothetical protein